MKSFIRATAFYVSSVFHKRNIIVVSEKKVKHFHISGKLQFVVLAAAISGICWASYSTGKFMAARSTLKEQSHAIRSLTTERVESSFPSDLPNSRLMPMAGTKSNKILSEATANMMFTPSTMDSIKLYARVASLERQVAELEQTNQVIVQQVRERADKHIAGIESIIRQAGLNLNDISRQASKVHRGGQGGPYIPARISKIPEATDMFASLDRLDLLDYILNTIPTDHPLDNADVVSSFGHRTDPFTRHLAFHAGIDLAGPSGAPVKATLEGEVISAGYNNAYGNMVDIRHNYGIVTRYAHLSRIKVSDGDEIEKGDVIGIQGSTGRSTGEHLHYEVRYNDKALNPKYFLNTGDYVSQAK